MNYIDALADRVRAALPEGLRPAGEARQLYRLYALLVLVRGSGTTAEDVHDAWSVWMAGLDPTHRSLIPFPELDHHTQLADRPYLDAIRGVAAVEQENSLARSPGVTSATPDPVRSSSGFRIRRRAPEEY